MYYDVFNIPICIYRIQCFKKYHGTFKKKKRYILMYLQDVSRYFKEYHGITVAHFQKHGINSIWYMSKKNPLNYHSPFLLVLSNYTSLSSMSYTWIVVEDDVE